MNTTVSTSYLKEHSAMEAEPSWPHTVAVLVDGTNESSAQFNAEKNEYEVELPRSGDEQILTPLPNFDESGSLISIHFHSDSPLAP